MPIKISGATAGSATLIPVATGADVDLTLPDHEGTIQTEVDLATGLSDQKTIVDGELETAINLIPGKNLLINGGFQVWQRSTNYVGNLSGYRSADRWVNNSTVDVARIGLIDDANSVYCARLQPGDSARQLMRLSQGIELHTSVLDEFTNQPLTFSVECSTTLTAKELVLVVAYKDVVDSDTNKVIVFNYQKIGDVPLGGFSKHTVSFTPSLSQAGTNKVLEVQFGMRDVGAGNISTSEQVYFKNVKLELGSVATPFDLPTIGETTLACKRYYQGQVLVTLTGISSSKYTYGSCMVSQMASTPTISNIGLTSDGGVWDSAFMVGGSASHIRAYARITSTPDNFSSCRVYGNAEAEL